MLAKHSGKCIRYGGKHAKGHSFPKFRHGKKYLATLAAIMSLVVGVSGTLMLLTHETPTAVNVMTAGNVTGELHEVVSNTAVSNDLTISSSNYDVDVVNNGSVDFGTFTPGASITKQPYVKNTGSVPAYVAMELIFWTTAESGNSTTENKMESFFGGLEGIPKANAVAANGWVTNPGYCSWYENAVDIKKYHRVYFLSTSGGELTALAANASSGKLFTEIKVPSTWGDEIEGFRFNLAVKAYLIQSDNVTPGTSTSNSSNQTGNNYAIKDWRAFFKGNFGTSLANLPS